MAKLVLNNGVEIQLSDKTTKNLMKELHEEFNCKIGDVFVCVPNERYCMVVVNEEFNKAALVYLDSGKTVNGWVKVNPSCIYLENLTIYPSEKRKVEIEIKEK